MQRTRRELGGGVKSCPCRLRSSPPLPPGEVGKRGGGHPERELGQGELSRSAVSASLRAKETADSPDPSCESDSGTQLPPPA